MEDKQRAKARKTLRRSLNSEYIKQYKEMSSCLKCPEARAVCLEFHHKDPATKKFAISEGRRQSIQAIDDEIAKCVVVCANCHRILHAEDARLGLAAVRDEDLEETLFDDI